MVIFEKDDLKNTLGEVLSAKGKHQLRIAETEKYPHVTFSSVAEVRRSFEGERTHHGAFTQSGNL